jgi:hypothetical protein
MDFKNQVAKAHRAMEDDGYADVSQSVPNRRLRKAGMPEGKAKAN